MIHINIGVGLVADISIEKLDLFGVSNDTETGFADCYSKEGVSFWPFLFGYDEKVLSVKRSS